jgi:hypothetical protein
VVLQYPLPFYSNASVGAKLRNVRGGAALANARADRDEVCRKFHRFSTPRRFRTVPQL